MPYCDRSCFTKLRNVVGDPQQSLSMAYSWNDIFREIKNQPNNKIQKKMMADQSCFFFFFCHSHSQIQPSQKPVQADVSVACQVKMLEGNGRSKVPSADGEPLGRSESQGAQHRCWGLWTSRSHHEEKAGGYSLVSRASGGCSRFAPEQVAWKFLHPGGGKAVKSLAKSAWEKKIHILIGILNYIMHYSSLMAEKGYWL